MKRIIVKILVLACVFAGSVYVFSMMINRNEVQSPRAVDAPTLPVLTMQYDGIGINEMFGYASLMDERTLRESVTLLPYDRNLSFSVDPYDAKIREIAYTVTSFEDGEVFENGRIRSYKADDSVQSVDFHLENPITMGQEYMLRFDVALEDGRVFYYYTRLIQRNGQNLNWYLSYVDSFYLNCLQKTLTDEMISQLEPETTESNSSLHFVNIHSDVSQITWGEMETVLLQKAVPTILEINETTVSVGLDYIVSSHDEQNNTEYYSVREYYRMRKAQDFVVLLDFERTVNQCFDGTLPVLTENGIDLGITGKDVPYMLNEAADTAVFIQSGEIWEYNRAANKVSRVFTFRTSDHNDRRCEHQEYGLSVSSVSEEGVVTFVVYGHMNNGIHEGENGISVFRYDEDDNTTKELLFIPSDQSFEMLEHSLSRLAYVNGNNQCFFAYEGSICSVSLSDLDSFVIQESLDWDTFAVSESQTLVAWTESTNGRQLTVTELNLETGDTLRIDAPKGEQIKSLGFMGEDLVYGLFKDVDRYTDETGEEKWPMYRVCLMDSAGDLAKEYSHGGIYIDSAKKETSMLTLKLFAYNEEGARYALPDEHIVYYEVEREDNVSVKLTVKERKGTEVQLVFTINGRSSNLLTLYTRYLVNDIAPTAGLARTKNEENRYYVYAKGSLYDIYSRVNEAIETADAQVGIVLNEEQQYVWERGNYKEAVTLSTEMIPKGLLNAPIEEEKIAKVIGNDYKVWNLSECTLASIKYQISNGYAVCAKWSDEDNVLIIGYDTFNIWIYNKKTGEPKAIALEDAEKIFDAAGNIFMSYHI